MADDESPLLRDIWISDAGMHITNEDSVSHTYFIDTDGEFFKNYINDTCIYHIVQIDNEAFVSPSDLFLLNYTKENEIIAETISVDQFLSNSSFDLLHSK